MPEILEFVGVYNNNKKSVFAGMVKDDLRQIFAAKKYMWNIVVFIYKHLKKSLIFKCIFEFLHFPQNQICPYDLHSVI